MDFLRQEIQNGVALVTLHDGSGRNSLSGGGQLTEVFDLRLHTEDMRALVLTGAGGHFCSGGDLNTAPPSSEEEARQRIDEVTHIIRFIHICPMPTIAADVSVVAGLGAGIALACDSILVSDRAKLLFPFSKLGLLLDASLLSSFKQRFGPVRARRFLI